MINTAKVISVPKQWLCVVALLVFGISTSIPTLTHAGDLVPSIYGAWATHEGGEVSFYDCGEFLCGDITKLRPPDAQTPTKDIYNPDTSLRNRSLIGLRMFSELEADSDGEWSGGKLYNTMEGKEYKSKLELNDDGTLKMSGCMMFFCKTFIWTKVDTTMIEAPHE